MRNRRLVEELENLYLDKATEMSATMFKSYYQKVENDLRAGSDLSIRKINNAIDNNKINQKPYIQMLYYGLAVSIASSIISAPAQTLSDQPASLARIGLYLDKYVVQGKTMSGTIRNYKATAKNLSDGLLKDTQEFMSNNKRTPVTQEIFGRGREQTRELIEEGTKRNKKHLKYFKKNMKKDFRSYYKWAEDQKFRGIKQIETVIERHRDVGDNRTRRYLETEFHEDLEKAKVKDGKNLGYTKKIWVSQSDKRVRETHRRANRQAVPIDKKFKVGSQKAKHPGDSNLKAGERIGCRCYVEFE